ncbi:MAG TPA: radical SAM protein [Terriglobales bacterium]|nr:radical SAM protein [Terriglobales bacterium]
MTLFAEMSDRAVQLGIPISVHLDVTYRCNERCLHCYLDHEDHGEMTLAEIKDVLAQLADAGTFVVSLSGGEVFMRRDFFDIVEYARQLLFSVKIKTNGVMVRDMEARRLAELGVHNVQISIYSDRPEVHDGITKLPGSLKRSLEAIRLLIAHGVRVTIANVLMTANLFDDSGVLKLAKEMGVSYTLDPMVTPKLDGDTSVLALRAPLWALQKAVRNQELTGAAGGDSLSSPAALDGIAEDLPCTAGHNSCYISPYGDVFPCVQFPLPSGNVRQQKFLDIWKDSRQLQQVRSLRNHDLSTCSRCSHLANCTRCPGLAYMEGDMCGPSTADCQQSFAKTGVPSTHMLMKLTHPVAKPSLIQIRTATQ